MALKLEPLLKKATLNQAESQTIANAFLDNNLDENTMVELLTKLYQKGESSDEILGFAQALRQHMTPVICNGDCIDICGTGGNTAKKYNVSTGIAFVLSTCGVPVVKHGNRGSKKANGSFDFLEALGIPFGQSPEALSQLFNTEKLCFIYAKNHHSAMRHVASARKALSHRSIFNLIGPLCNPATPPYQIIACTEKKVADALAPVVQALGTKRSLIIVGANGHDELHLNGQNLIYDIQNKTCSVSEFKPDFIDHAHLKSDDCSDAIHCAQLFESLMKNGDTQHEYSVLMALNAGAALYCFNQASTIKEGYEQALNAIKDHRVWTRYTEYKQHCINESQPS